MAVMSASCQHRLITSDPLQTKPLSLEVSVLLVTSFTCLLNTAALVQAFTEGAHWQPSRQANGDQHGVPIGRRTESLAHETVPSRELQFRPAMFIAAHESLQAQDACRNGCHQRAQAIHRENRIIQPFHLAGNPFIQVTHHRQQFRPTSARQVQQAAQAFAAQLRVRCALPVVLVDERASSIEAAQRFAADRAQGRRKRRDAAALDAVAAAVIVERWLAAPQDALAVP